MMSEKVSLITTTSKRGEATIFAALLTGCSLLAAYWLFFRRYLAWDFWTPGIAYLPVAAMLWPRKMLTFLVKTLHATR
jgi:hypothetical protein